MKKNKIYIIYSPWFDENSWGVIVLHYLCHLLNQLWEKAYLFNYTHPVRIKQFNLRGVAEYIIETLKIFIKKFLFTYKTYKSFNTPIITNINSIDKSNSIIVYPEIVSGNPSGANNVVRWFLNKPWKLSWEINYWENELYFFQQEVFNDPIINKNSDNLLRLIYIFNNIYKKINFWERKWSSYILRKGRWKKNIHNLQNSIKIDWLNHKKVAEIFNKTEIFYSYDPYTFYSYYAIMCWCKSVVIPESNISKDEWQPDPDLRCWILYWPDDIEEQDNWIEKMNQFLKKEEENWIMQVKSFITKCNNFFHDKS